MHTLINSSKFSEFVRNEIFLSRLPVDNTRSDNHNGHTNHNHFPSLSNDEQESPSLAPAISYSPLHRLSVSEDSSKSQAQNKTCGLKPNAEFATPEQVLELYFNKLTPYERREIFDYSHIYFVGACSKKRPGIIGSNNNSGYDNEQGSYHHVLHDHIAYRFEVLKVSFLITYIIINTFHRLDIMNKSFTNLSEILELFNYQIMLMASNNTTFLWRQ